MAFNICPVFKNLFLADFVPPENTENKMFLEVFMEYKLVTNTGQKPIT